MPPPPARGPSPYLWAGAVALATLLLALFVDRALFQWVQGAPAQWVALAKVLTQAGDSAYTLVPTGVALLLLWPLRALAVDPGLRARLGCWIGRLGFVFLAVASSGLLIQLLKAAFGRARPRLLLREQLYGWYPFQSWESDFASFPSGHANTLMAASLAIGLLLPRRWRLPLLILGALLASTRVWVSAHFASDVLAGGAIGIATTLLLHRAFVRRGWLPGAQQGPAALPGA